MSTIRIKILQPALVTQPDPSKTYKQMIVTHLDLSNGKPDGKKLIDIYSKGVWSELLNVKEGEVYEIEREKNAKGYWEWKKVTLSKAEATDASPTTASSATSRSSAGATGSRADVTPARVGSWETPEERSAKQVYIVRQSSITNAIAFLKIEGDAGTEVKEVIAIAKQFEDYVFGGVADLTNDQPE